MGEWRQSVFNVLFDAEGAAIASTDAHAVGEALHGGRGVSVFNTLTGTLAVLSEDGVHALLGSNGEAFPELVEGGFLVPADAPDERRLLSDRYLRDMNETGFLALCIAPTMACNLRCVYCYEGHEAVRMSSEVEEGIMRFVLRRHDAYAFSHLDVLWYGGEPVLELELIERLSQRLSSWCASKDVTYSARMISNTSLVDGQVARRLARAGVTEVMPTLDGCAGCHDARRAGGDGSGSYDRTREGIAAFRRAGVNVGVNCNLDRENVDDFRRLRAEFADDPGLAIYASHLRNYGGWFDNPSVREGLGAPDLLSRQEYADRLFELYAEEHPSAASVASSLAARRSFCLGTSASYFVIDPEGNAYRCDGRMRDERYVLFNVLDSAYPISWPQERSFMEENPRCAECAEAPLCLGDCNWEWSLFDDNCIALKYTLGRYVGLLRERLEDEPCSAATGDADGAGDAECALLPIRLLMPPRDIEAFYATPFSPWA